LSEAEVRNNQNAQNSTISLSVFQYNISMIEYQMPKLINIRHNLRNMNL